MKVSELWVRSLINLPESIEKLIDQLTNAGIEVDSIEKIEKSEGQPDSILTLKVPANRGDVLSIEGVVREVALLNMLPFSGIDVENCFPNIKDTLPIRILAKQACPRYLGRIIQNIKGGVSTPEWMKTRLEKAGLRPISAAVDIMNYVMLELGQPLHAFDLNRIHEEIVVRKAYPSETLITLDNQTVELDDNVLIIADKQSPLAIAGIIGGLNSAVSDSTQNLFIESAYFEPIQIRLTSKRINVRSESSHRFERGIDPKLQERALERATQLVLEILGGNSGPVVEHLDTHFLSLPQSILLRLSRIRDILGVCPKEETQDILNRLGMNVETVTEGFRVTPPSFRVDVQSEIDLIEEIARIYGYDRIPKTNPLLHFAYPTLPEAELPDIRFKQLLVDRGYNEAITYSFLDEASIQPFNTQETLLRLKNPISEELSVMRTSLWPGLLKAAQYNQRRQQSRIRLFETGLCFKQSHLLSDQTVVKQTIITQNANQSAIDHTAIEQTAMLAGVCLGSQFNDQWGIMTKDIDFFDVKNDVEALLALTGKLDYRFLPAEHSALHPGQTATIVHSGSEAVIGWIGALHPRLIKALDLQGPVLVFELDLTVMTHRLIPKFHELSNYPSIRRDIAIILDKKVLAQELKSAIVKCVGTLLKEVIIFDVYQGKGIEPGFKSIAIGLVLQHPSRTLRDAEVNEEVQKVIKELNHQFQATLRE